MSTKKVGITQEWIRDTSGRWQLVLHLSRGIRSELATQAQRQCYSDINAYLKDNIMQPGLGVTDVRYSTSDPAVKITFRARTWRWLIDTSSFCDAVAVLAGGEPWYGWTI